MRHLDLFSGIGGFALAARWVWGEYHKVVAFCECDLFCQQVLKKHWTDVEIIKDIKDCDGKRFEGKVDILTGGFPCQPFSCAGKRRGEEDDRYLWPQMFRIIREVRPLWVIGENVAGFVGMVLDKSITDLEMEGYETQSYIIPACAVNAPHRRDRVWIIARNTYCIGLEGGWAKKEVKNRYLETKQKTFGDTKSTRQQSCTVRQGKIQYGRTDTGNVDWNENWPEIATRLCRMDDGLSIRMDGFELSKAKHRENRIKAIGNAIVPWVVFVIMQAIKFYEEAKEQDTRDD